MGNVGASITFLDGGAAETNPLPGQECCLSLLLAASYYSAYCELALFRAIDNVPVCRVPVRASEKFTQ